jgi:hypothetical protein
VSLAHTVTHELKQVGWVTLYFLIFFGLVLLLKKLFLAEYRIEVYALSAAVIGALVAAKVVVILDKTRLGTRFDASHAVGVAALYKTLCYAGATFLVLLAEKLFHAYRAAGVFDQAVANVWRHRDWDIILAKVLVIGIAYAGYHLYAGVERRLGVGVLRRAIWRGRDEFRKNRET